MNEPENRNKKVSASINDPKTNDIRTQEENNNL